MTNDDARWPAICRARRLALQAGVTAALGLLLAGAALAEEQADDPAPATMPAEAVPAEPGVVCRVSGYDVIIRNDGTEPIASGASVDWSVPFARVEGSHVLTAVLDPGGRVFLTGALGSNFLGSDAECVADLADTPAQPAGGDNAPVSPAPQ